MRELSRFVRQSARRDAHRDWYDHYIQSPKWWARRREWESTERERTGSELIMCRGGCGAEWTSRRGDLHHCDYDRLGAELHEDLWPMCRGCHERLHEQLVASRSWRKIPRRVANELALKVIRGDIGDATNLADWL